MANVAIGSGAEAEGGRIISIGENAGKGVPDNWNIHNVNIGTQAGGASKESNSVAIGYQAGFMESAGAKQAQANRADGTRAANLYIGSQAGHNSYSYGNIALGTQAGDNVNDTRSNTNISIGSNAGQYMKSNDGVNEKFIGYGPGGNIAIGAAAAQSLAGDDNVAIGGLAGRNSKGDNNVFMGHLAGYQSTYHASVVLGGQTGGGDPNAVHDKDVMIGNYANGAATGNTRNVISIGSSPIAEGYESIAIGFNAKAKANNANAMGRMATATALDSIAVGTATETSGEKGIAIGYQSNVSGENSIAIGRELKVSGANSGAFGDPSTVSGNGSYSFGNNNTISKDGTFVLGSNVTASQANSVILGQNSTDRAATSVNQAKVGSVTYGGFAGVGSEANGVVSVGAAGKERQVIHVAAGEISTSSTDGINGSQLYSVASKVSENADAITNINTKIDNVAAASTHYYSVKSSEQGDGSNYNNDGAKGRNSLAAGVNASAKGFESTAIGYGAKTTQDNAIAVGNGSQSIGKNGIAIGTGAVAGSTGSNYIYGNIAIGTGANSAGGVAIGDNSKAGSLSLAAGIGSEAGDRAAAVGYSNNASGQWSTAVGVGNEATALSSTAVGSGNNVSGENSAAVGVTNVVAQKDTFVLGSNVTTTQENSVVLGANSTDRAATSETKGTITLSDGTTREYGNFAGTSPTGVVSVGDTGKERQIINVAAGKISADSTDAVNGSQLYSLAGEVGKNADAINNINTQIDTINTQITNVTSEAGKHTTVKAGNNKNLTVTEGTNAAGGKEYTVDLSENINIDGPGKDGKDGQDGHMGINGKDGVSGVGIDGKDGISVKGDKGEVGINGNDGISIKGADGKDAVSINGKDGVGHIGLTGPAGTNGKDGTNAVDISVKNGYNGADGVNGATGVDGKDGITRIVYEDKTGEHQVATLDDGMKYGGDSGDVIAKKLNNQVNVIGGIKDESKLTSADNIGVVSDGKDNLKVRLAKDIDLGKDGSVKMGDTVIKEGSITTGDTTINNNGVTINNGPSITKNGIDGGGTTITNINGGSVAPGSTDAVNGGQLYNVTRKVGDLGNRINKVGAGAAALAALHPLDFDPDDKWDVAVGYGNYRNANAAAVGVFYRPNEDTMVSVGGSMGNGENMVNAGFSVKLGQGNHVSTSRVAMAKEILALREENKQLKNRLDDMDRKLNAVLGIFDPSKEKTFPDVPANHWAYKYVTTLAGNGLLEGYPDGNFDGDRTMTRYEWAALFYRALEKGAPVDENMKKAMTEFAPEMAAIGAGRFRVDRISGKDNDRNKVERVRVNNEDNPKDNDYRDIYGGRIEKK